MSTTKKTVTKRARESPTSQSHAFHQVSSLLHSVRRIKQHEDELCTLVQEIKQSGTLSSEIANELRNLLDQLPAQDYLDDLIAVRSLPSMASPIRSSASPTKKASLKKSTR